MNRFQLAAMSATLLIAGAVSAEAANTAGPVEQDSQAVQAADHVGPATSIRQQIQSQLSKDGYTNIEIMPSSFMVRAKNKLGSAVEMIIGPDSFTEVTEVAPKAAAAPMAMAAPKAATGDATSTPAPKN